MHATPQGTDADIDGRRAWLRLIVCMLLGTVGSVGMWSIVVVLPAVQAEFGVSRGAASLPYTLTMLGFAAGNVLLGRIMDRMGVIPPLLAGIVCLAAGYALAAAVGSVIPFAILQGVIGFGAAATFSPLIADLSHWFRRRRGIAVAAAATGNYVAGAFWPLAMQLTLPAYGWRATYLAIGAICLLLGLYALNQLPLDYAGIALIVLGLTLMAVEAFTPTFGVAGFGGLVAFIFGAAMLVDSENPDFQISWWTIAGTAIASAAVLILLLGYTLRAMRRPVATGAEEFAGAEARVLEWAHGEGYVHIHGERWHARGPEELAPHSTVRVEKLDGLTLLVR